MKNGKSNKTPTYELKTGGQLAVRSEPPKNGEILPPDKPDKKKELSTKQKFCQQFLSDFTESWRVHGKKAIAQLAAKDPVSFVRVAALLVPKDLLVEGSGSQIIVVRLSDEDMAL
jgi:hypothetical protein